MGRGDTVAVLLSNTPLMLEAHHGVAMTGCVLNSLNTRLDAPAIAFMLDHSEAKVFIVDRSSLLWRDGAGLAQVKPRVIVYDDREFPQTGNLMRRVDYEEFLSGGDPEFDLADAGR